MAEQERDGSVDRISITLERAVQFANSLTHEYVTLEHLLFSILEEQDVSDLLTDMEVKTGDIIKDVEKYLFRQVLQRICEKDDNHDEGSSGDSGSGSDSAGVRKKWRRLSRKKVSSRVQSMLEYYRHVALVEPHTEGTLGVNEKTFFQEKRSLPFSPTKGRKVTPHEIHT